MLKNRPKVIIVGGANWIGNYLIDTIISNGGDVILIDDFNTYTSYYVNEYLKKYKKSFYFFEKSKFDINQFKKISYILNIQSNIHIDKYEVSSRKFINETAFMDKLLSFAADYNSRFLYVSTIKNHKKYLSNEFKQKEINYSYGSIDLQYYLEMLVLEYVQKVNLDASILRVADIIGPGMELNTEENWLSTLFKEALSDLFITIKGDGLSVQNILYVDDAVNGILRTLFTENIAGKKFSLMHNENPSLLYIASKILEFPGVKAKNIKFIEDDDIDDLYLYLPDTNITQIGWEPKISVEEALYKTFLYYQANYKDLVALDSKLHKNYSHNLFNNKEKYQNDNLNEEIEIQISLDDKVKHQKIIKNILEFSNKGNLNNIQPNTNKILLNKENSNVPNFAVNISNKSNFFRWWNNKFNYIVTFILLFIVFWSIIFPVFRVFSFITFVDHNLNRLLSNIYFYSDELNQPNLVESFHRDLYFVEIGLYLSGNVEQLNNIKSGLSGIERTYLVYDKFREYRSYGLFDQKDISEDFVIKLNSLETETKVALDEVKYLQKITLPENTKNKVDQIVIWLEKTIEQINNYQKK